ncbi:MAG TPA: hypothetical protein PK054_12615 [Anaerohalosphaeraceae bacterium]|nr:hypothetical protein [Anaerohalosphaeraceae bacterium]
MKAKNNLFWLFGNTQRYHRFAEEEADFPQEEPEEKEDGLPQEALDVQDEFDLLLDETYYSGEEPDESEKKEGPQSIQKPDLKAPRAKSRASSDEEPEDEEDQTPEEEEEPKKSTRSSRLPEDLIQRARRLGMDDDEVMLFKNPQTLKRILDSLESPNEGAKGSTAKQEESPAPDNPFVYKTILADSPDWDEELKRDLQQRDEHYGTLFNNVISEILSIREELNTARFDAKIASLGPEYEDLFGKGTKDDLDPRSPAYENRKRLDMAIRTIQRGRERLGKDPLPYSEAFERALHSEFYKELEAMKESKFQKKLRNQERRILSRPSSKNTSKLTGYESALDLQHEFDSRLQTEL